MQWLANLLTKTTAVILSTTDGRCSWRIVGCQVRLIEDDFFVGGVIEGPGKLSSPLYVEIFLDSSKLDLLDLNIDILEDGGSRYLNASSIPGLTKVLFLTKAEDDRPRVTIERTFRRHD